MARRICQGMFALYVVLAAAAFLIVPVSNAGWFGLAPDALIGLYAIVLALPWSLMFIASDTQSALSAYLSIAAELALNAAIIWLACRAVTRRAQR